MIVQADHKAPSVTRIHSQTDGKEREKKEAELPVLDQLIPATPLLSCVMSACMRQSTIDTIITVDTINTINTAGAISEYVTWAGYAYATGVMRRHLTYSAQVPAGNDCPHCSFPPRRSTVRPTSPPAHQPAQPLEELPGVPCCHLPSAISHLAWLARPWSRLEHTRAHPGPSPSSLPPPGGSCHFL